MFLMASIKDLADYIGAMRSRCARAPQFDLCHLTAEHGSDAVNEALQICRQAELKASLSVSGERCRRHDARADERTTQAAFLPNKLVSKLSWWIESNTWCPRFTAAMILLGSLVQVKGLWVCIGVVEEAVDSMFEFLEGAEYAALEALLVSFAKKPSTALSQEADVRVKWNTNRGCLSIHSRALGCLWAA